MRILFIDFSTKLESIDDLTHRARGGMVTSLFKVSDALSQFGHNVYVLSDIKTHGKTEAGVYWFNPDTFHEKFDADVLVCNRGIGRGYANINAKHRVLWTHDLPHSGFAQNPRNLGAFSKVVFMSKYAERAWRTFFRTIGKSVIIPNGVDKDIFHPYDTALKPPMPYRMIFCSAPNRGLKRLPLIFDAVKTRINTPVAMFAFSNMAKLHPNEKGDGFSLDYKSCKDAGIQLRDPVPQPELAMELASSDLMILPTDYPEICSNVILQSLACGTPVITTGNLGSAPEWIKHGRNGMLTKFHPVDYMVHTVEMVRNAVRVLEDRKLHARMCRNAAKTKILSWDEVGAKWNKMIARL